MSEVVSNSTIVIEDGTDSIPDSLLWAKLGFAFAVFLISFVSGVLPLKIKGCGSNNPLFMSVANAFSGGLFLAIALIHILPEVAMEYEHYVEDHHESAAIHTLIRTGQVSLMARNGSEIWNPSSNKGVISLHGHGESHPFPLPYVLAFAGYALILLIDKVLFDSHELLATVPKEKSEEMQQFSINPTESQVMLPSKIEAVITRRLS